jgi:diacylglycerol kinase family enzyme
MLWGAWRDDEVIEFEKVQRLTVAGKKKTVLATMDGEVLTLELPLDFAVRPKVLQVLAPREAEPAPEKPAASETALA